MHDVLSDKIRKSWTESTLHGFEFLSRGLSLEAAQRWLEANALRDGVQSGFESLAATSSANAGAAHLLCGEWQAAASHCDDAVQSWRHIISGIETLDVPMTGASSSFHFRLAASAPDALTAARRNRYRHLAQSALAIVQFHRTLAEQKLAVPIVARHAPGLATRLSDVLGRSSPEVRLLSLCLEPDREKSIPAIYADKVADFRIRQPTFAATLSETCAQLEIAVALAALIIPSLCAPAEGASTAGGKSISQHPHRVRNDV